MRYALHDMSTHLTLPGRYATQRELAAARDEIVRTHGVFFAKYIRFVDLGLPDEYAN
jgi:hypothetical protein